MVQQVLLRQGLVGLQPQEAWLEQEMRPELEAFSLRDQVDPSQVQVVQVQELQQVGWQVMHVLGLKASSLRAVPFDADGISYLDTEWPVRSSTGADSGDPNGRRFRFLF